MKKERKEKMEGETLDEGKRKKNIRWEKIRKKERMRLRVSGKTREGRKGNVRDKKGEIKK